MDHCLKGKEFMSRMKRHFEEVASWNTRSNIEPLRSIRALLNARITKLAPILRTFHFHVFSHATAEYYWEARICLHE